MRTADLQKRILKQFPHQEFYGYEVHKVLASDGVELGISRLYRVLNVMLKEGLLESRWIKSHVGPRKRMYRLSNKGREALNEIFLDAIKIVHNYYGLYLLQLRPKINVFEQIFELLAPNLLKNERLLFITQDFMPMHEMIIQTLHRHLPHGKIFLVKPPTLDIDINLANLSFLDGDYTDLPLKTNYVDRMIIIDLPKQDTLKQALQEWHRVLTDKGVLTILTPTILLEHFDDPLTIGDFIEKHEHETIEKGEHVDKRYLKQQLQRYFRDIEEHSLVHMTVLRIANARH